ncbi:MAG: ATP-binding protein [Candidatus Faecousia sp.]|nr:ATP-binding protein [Candidatus Faecousia sp.]
MSRKIFNAIWLVAVAVFLASLAFLMGITYDYFTHVQLGQLKAETQLAAQGVMLSGEAYFDDLPENSCRMTWIAADGTVLYDSDADSTQMENHLEREEVRQALEQGYGQSSRYSNTLADKQLYAAQRLPDNSVLRLSIVQMSVWTLLLSFARPICIVIFLALIFSFLLASRLAKKIVEPINNIDPDDPAQYYGRDNYREVEPLLRRIAHQQELLKRDKAQIEKASLIRQEFTANVSHELKTPLHAISGYAELLENGMVREDDIRPFAGKIRRESARMAKLVEDIIDLTKLDNGGAEMVWEDCDLYRIAENAVDSLESAAAEGEVTLHLMGEPSPMRGVPQLLHSIVYNLCDNAIKYHRPGGEVWISVSQQGDRTILRVKDNGIGIPKESQDRIFERFYRVDKSRSKAVGGTGLGLSIVKHAVLIHKGAIRVESEPGQGTQFVVTLPVQEA